MNLRMPGCRNCEQITSGDCGMHGSIIYPMSTGVEHTLSDPEPAKRALAEPGVPPAARPPQRYRLTEIQHQSGQYGEELWSRWKMVEHPEGEYVKFDPEAPARPHPADPDRLSQIRTREARFTDVSRILVNAGLAPREPVSAELENEADELIHDLACDVGWFLAQLPAEAAVVRPHHADKLIETIRFRIRGLVNHGAEICATFQTKEGNVSCGRCGYMPDVHLLRDCLVAFESSHDVVRPHPDLQAQTASERFDQQPVENLVQQTVESLRPATLQERIAQWREQHLTPTPAASDFERGYAEGRTFAFERCADEAELAAAQASGRADRETDFAWLEQHAAGLSEKVETAREGQEAAEEREDRLRVSLRALEQKWSDPEFWKHEGAIMDSFDCAKEIAVLLTDPPPAQTKDSTP